MDVMELFDILKQGEGIHTEFKIDFTKQAHDIAKELAALANSGGGILLMGVDDDGNPKGISEPNRVIERLAGIARSCKPSLLPEIDKVQIGKDIFIVYAKVPPSAKTPSLYQGKYFVRVGSCSEEASGGDELISLLRNIGSSESRTVSVPSRLFSPPPTRGFKGRKKELERLTTLLNSKTISMIVVEGISGIGKTALSANFATAINQQDYLSFWMDCREDTSFDAVAFALATFSRSNNNGDLADLLEDVTIKLEDRLARIAAAIAEHKYAFFFDDYHLVTDPMVNRLLQKIGERALCPKLFMICRWRPRLAVSLSPLLLVEETLRAGLDPGSCAQFLTECGLDAPKDVAHKIWKLTGEGHPKALEIFIARSRNYPVSELLSSLPVFREELRNEWLTPLMNELPQEQRDIAIDLSVFDRPTPLQAMGWLYPGKEVGSLIVALADRFILDRMGENSVRMHLLIREFCYSLIPDKKSKHIWAAEYYIKQGSTEYDPEMISDTQIDARIASWSHLIKAEDHVRATEELNKIRAPLMNRGQYEQVMFLIEQTPMTPENEDWYTIHKARILSLWGDFDTAASIICSLVSSPIESIAREAVLVLATIYNDHSKGELSKELLEKHHDRFLKNIHPLIRRRFLSRLVEAHFLLGNLDQALSWASKILEACEAEGEEISGAVSLRQMAAVLQSQKKLDMALALCQHSHNLLAKHKRMRDAATTEVLMASIYKELGDYESASQHLHNSLESFTKMGDRKNNAICKQRIKELQDVFEVSSSQRLVRNESGV